MAKKSYLAQIADILKIDVDDIEVSMNSKLLPICYPGTAHSGYFFLKYDQITVASFVITQLYGCCGVAVSSRAFVGEDYRNKGIGRIINKMRQQIAWQWNYNLILATNVDDGGDSWGDDGMVFNAKILEKENWKVATKFMNENTDNKVTLRFKHLKNTGRAIGFDLAGAKRDVDD